MKNFAIFCFSTLIILSFSCSRNLAPLSSSDEYNPDLDDQIYTIVLNQIVEEKGKGRIILYDSTISEDISYMYGSIYHHLDSIELETIYNYERVNENPVTLTTSPELTVECFLVPRDSINFPQYPKDASFCIVSRVGYNKTKTQALLYISNGSINIEDASGSLVFLVKKENWQIAGYYGLWIA